MRTSHAASEGGFTIPELLVVAGVLVIGAIAALFFLHPKSYDAKLRDGQRLTELAHIAQAITKYTQATGHLPDGISSDVRKLGTEAGQLDLCDALVPAYLKDMPVDPVFGVSLQEGGVCDETLEGDYAYATAYTVVKSSDGKLTFAALLPESKPQLTFSTTPGLY
jgi:type II secretory pathway pseudopilin PulG